MKPRQIIVAGAAAAVMASAMTVASRAARAREYRAAVEELLEVDYAVRVRDRLLGGVIDATEAARKWRDGNGPASPDIEHLLRFDLPVENAYDATSADIQKVRDRVTEQVLLSVSLDLAIEPMLEELSVSQVAQSGRTGRFPQALRSLRWGRS